MIYLDTSVLLARLFAEDRQPPASLWDESLISNRLIEYETWTRLNARGSGRSHGDDAKALLSRVAMIEMIPLVLGRALAPFPLPVRTLDSLHLASMHFLREQKQPFRLATYDERLFVAARALDFEAMSL